MIYTAESSVFVESGDFTPISAIDAIMDINEALIEYNETSYLYEGVGDNIKNLARNIGTKVTNAINTLIQKIKTMMMDNAFKRFEKIAKDTKKVLSGASSEFTYKVVNREKDLSTIIGKLGDALIKEDKALSDAKKEISDKFKDSGLIDGGQITDFKTTISDLKTQAKNSITDLTKTKNEALKKIVASSDPTTASKYASFVVWACNFYTNKILSLTTSTVNRAIKLYERKEKKKSDNSSDNK